MVWEDEWSSPKTEMGAASRNIQDWIGNPDSAQGVGKRWHPAPGDSGMLSRRHRVTHSTGRNHSRCGFWKCCIAHILRAGPEEKLNLGLVRLRIKDGA